MLADSFVPSGIGIATLHKSRCEDAHDVSTGRTPADASKQAVVMSSVRRRPERLAEFNPMHDTCGPLPRTTS
jgi:hypothetical protein